MAQDVPPAATQPAADTAAGLLCMPGRPRLQWPARPPLLLSPRDAALLVLVVLHGPLARATLAAWLWPDVAATGALNNLRQRLFQLPWPAMPSSWTPTRSASMSTAS